MKNLQLLLDTDEQKMFVLVRNDLYSESYKAVQGGHAVAEYLLNNDITKMNWNNGYMIYLVVKNENQLKKYARKITMNKKFIPFSCFTEPDLNNEITALACVCDGKIFKELDLL